jgi:hypothetical protein
MKCSPRFPNRAPRLGNGSSFTIRVPDWRIKAAIAQSNNIGILGLKGLKPPYLLVGSKYILNPIFFTLLYLTFLYYRL